MPLVSASKNKDKNNKDSMDEDDGEGEDVRTVTQRLESAYLLLSVQSSLLADQLSHLQETSSGGVKNSTINALHSSLIRTDLDVDKTLLQLIAQECLVSEETGMKALEMVKLIKDRGGSGKMLEAASKVARRYERWGLEERIRTLAEERLRGEVGDVDGLVE